MGTPASESVVAASNVSSPEQAGVLLVVDDDSLNLDMLSRRLDRSGFTVHSATSGQMALDLIKQIPFDLVLLDQMMPGMSGTAVLRTLRADAATALLPIIMVTAVASSDKISEALEDGANDYLTKPIDYKVALARIRTQMLRGFAERQLRQSEERYALASKASRDGLWDWDLVTGHIYYSARWKEMLGAEQVFDGTAQAWFSRVLAVDRPMLEETIESYLQGSSEVLACEYRMRHLDDTIRWMACHAVAQRNGSDVAIRLTGSQSDIAEEKTRDPLTGLPNRLRLLAELEWALESASQRHLAPAEGQPGFALLFLDLNDFKSVNDTLGHLVGDHLLILVAARLELAAKRWADLRGAERPALIARMGGDEFAVLLQGKIDEGSVAEFAREVRDLMQESFVLDKQTVHCAFSIGASIATDRHVVPEDLLREADIAMYTTKIESLGKLALFHPRMRDVATQQFELENEIRSAAARGEFKLVYQPKVDLATGTTYGVEALVRWQHPGRGLLQPGLFIPIAERTGTIIDIGKWVLRRACEEVREWQEQFSSGAPLALSVNLSPREFRQKNLVASIRQTLEETRFPAASLHFEVTETALFADFSAARETLNALKDLGVGLDLDDFGTGYSSLKYLGELPFDTLKIDRYFIASLDAERSSSSELVGAILSMADVLELDVVAEGIETEAHRVTLSDLGCRFGQGYLFAKPLDPGAMHRLLLTEQGAERRFTDRPSQFLPRKPAGGLVLAKLLDPT